MMTSYKDGQRIPGWESDILWQISPPRVKRKCTRRGWCCLQSTSESVIIKVQKLLAVFFIVIVNIFDVHWGLSRVPYWMSTPLKLSQNRMRRVVCSSSWHPDCRNPMKIVAWSRDGCSHVWIFFKMLGGKKGKGTSIFSQILELEMVKWSFQ